MLYRMGIRVGTHDGEDRDADKMRLVDRDRMQIGVHREHEAGKLSHLLDAAENHVHFLDLPVNAKTLFLCVFLEETRRAVGFQFLKVLDAAGDRLEVGERAAKPSVHHVGEAEFLRQRSHAFVRGGLGPDQKDLLAVGNRFFHRFERCLERLPGLRHVDEFDAVPRSEDTGLHPGMRLGLAPAVAKPRDDHLAENALVDGGVESGFGGRACAHAVVLALALVLVSFHACSVS